MAKLNEHILGRGEKRNDAAITHVRKLDDSIKLALLFGIAFSTMIVGFRGWWTGCCMIESFKSLYCKNGAGTLLHIKK
jgi:hypothetical protein